MVSLCPWPTLATSAAILVGIGLAVGLPAGIGYHLKLARALADNAPSWRVLIVAPTSLHPQLVSTVEPQIRAAVMRWFYLGAAGFSIVMLGVLLMIAALIRGEIQ